MNIPKTLIKFKEIIEDIYKDDQYQGYEDEERVPYCIDLKTSYKFESSEASTEWFYTLKEAQQGLKNVYKEEVEEVATKKGRPKGTTKTITRNKRLEIRTTEDKNIRIKELIKLNKQKYGTKNSDDLLITALEKLLKE